MSKLLVFYGSYRSNRMGVRLARHALRNGNGGGLIHHRGRSDRASLVRGGQTDRRGRQGAGAVVSAVCRRSDLVDGSRERATTAKQATVLKGRLRCADAPYKVSANATAAG